MGFQQTVWALPSGNIIVGPLYIHRKQHTLASWGPNFSVCPSHKMDVPSEKELHPASAQQPPQCPLNAWGSMGLARGRSHTAAKFPVSPREEPWRPGLGWGRWGTPLKRRILGAANKLSNQHKWNLKAILWNIKTHAKNPRWTKYQSFKWRQGSAELMAPYASGSKMAYTAPSLILSLKFWYFVHRGFFWVWIFLFLKIFC